MAVTLAIGLAAIAVAGARAEPAYQQLHGTTLTCQQLAPGSLPVATRTVSVGQGTNIAVSAKHAFVISYEVSGATITSWKVVRPEVPPPTDPGVRLVYVRYKTPSGLVAQGNYYAPDNGVGDAKANLTLSGATDINTVTFCVNNFEVPETGSGNCAPGRCNPELPPYWVTIQSLDGETVNESCSCNFDSVVCDPANESTAPEYPPCVTPGENLGGTPNSLVTWTNSGACSTRYVKVGGQWVCLTPKPAQPSATETKSGEGGVAE